MHLAVQIESSPLAEPFPQALICIFASTLTLTYIYNATMSNTKERDMISPLPQPQSFLTLEMFVSTFTNSNLNFHHKLNQHRTSSTISNISKKYSYVLYFVFRRKHWRNLPGLICIYVFPAYVLSWGCIDKYRRGINNFSLKFLSICICGFELMTSPCDLY